MAPLPEIDPEQCCSCDVPNGPAGGSDVPGGGGNGGAGGGGTSGGPGGNGGGPPTEQPTGPVTEPDYPTNQPDVDYSEMCSGNGVYLTAADPVLSESWAIL